jgi:hypothetical protein
MTPATIPQEWPERTVCPQMALGVLQDVLLPSMIEELWETSQREEEHERTRKRIVRTSGWIGWLLSPHVSQRAVSATLVSGLRASRDQVPQEISATSAFRSRREPLGSERVKELFRPRAAPNATAETPGNLLERKVSRPQKQTKDDLLRDTEESTNAAGTLEIVIMFFLDGRDESRTQTSEEERQF